MYLTFVYHIFSILSIALLDTNHGDQEADHYYGKTKQNEKETRKSCNIKSVTTENVIIHPTGYDWVCGYGTMRHLAKGKRVGYSRVISNRLRNVKFM